MGLCDSHSYQALFKTATRAMAVSRMDVGSEVLVRIAPRKEFLDWSERGLGGCIDVRAALDAGDVVHALLRACDVGVHFLGAS